MDSRGKVRNLLISSKLLVFCSTIFFTNFEQTTYYDMARDFIHEGVKKAFIKNGWKILEDPLQVDLIDDSTYFEIDLGAEKINKNGQAERIFAIEIKSFNRPSIINSFHETLGQYLNYQAAIFEDNLDYQLFIAVSQKGWEKLSSFNFIQRRIKQFNLKFVIIDVVNHKILSWEK